MEELITTREFYETVDLIITPVILADRRTVCQDVNKAFLSQIGYNPEDIYDQETWFEKAYADDDYRNEVKATWRQLKKTAGEKGESHVHMIAKVHCADGSSKWFDIHENMFGYNKVVTFLDVNELQENNEQLTD